MTDLTYLSWSKAKNSSGTAGSFLKSYSDLGGKKIYYKLSNYDSYKGITGHECLNEIVADRLLDILHIPHLHYELIDAEIMVDNKIISARLCASEDFKKAGESKIALDAYYQVENTALSPLEFCIEHGFGEYIGKMLLFDYLILNRDRHGANIEVLRNRNERTIRLAPLFDHGLSLLFSCHDEKQMAAFDVMADLPVQCFVGTQSAADNLKLIPAGTAADIGTLRDIDRDRIFEGIQDIMPDIWYEKVWEMISKRWRYYEENYEKNHENICNKG